eukprot:2049279-Pyramimonas_sp.AAC.1
MRRRRRRTGVNPRGINDVVINPPSKLFSHSPLNRFSSIEGLASLEDNRFETLQHAKHMFSEFQRHGST